MHKFILITLVFVFSLSVAYGQTTQTTPKKQIQVLQDDPNFVAIVTKLNGNVFIQRKKDTTKWEKAKLNLTLYEGDKVRTEVAATATLWLRAGGTTVMKPKETLIVTAPQEKKSDPVFSNLWEAFTRKIRRSQMREGLDSMLAIKSYNAAYEIEALSPRNTKLLTVPIFFEWSEVPTAKEYVLTIGYFAGAQKIWQTKVNGTKFSFDSKSLPDFAVGKPYLWEIEAYDDKGKPIASDSTWFIILPLVERDAMKTAIELVTQSASSDKATINLLLAAYCEDNELYWESERLLRELLVEVNQPIIHLMLGDLYLRLGLMRQSQLELQKGSEVLP